MHTYVSGLHVVVPLQLEWFTKGDSKGSIVLTNFLVKCVSMWDRKLSHTALRLSSAGWV